jgi:septum formation protein
VTVLVLASASTARAAMLAAAGVDAEVMPARIDEAAIKQAMPRAPARATSPISWPR